MHLQLIPSAVGVASQSQFLSTYLLNDRVAIDGGSIGLIDDRARQCGVRDLLLTHAHADHVASLGIWLDNIYDPGQPPPTIYCLPAVAETLRQHYFNDAIWPNLLRLPSITSPAMRIQEIEPGAPFHVADLTVIAVEVCHSVPAVGFIIRDRRGTLVFSGDTGPTETIWETAGRWGSWQVSVLELAFPNALQDRAGVAGHLTPELFAREVRKMPADCRVYGVHLKSAYREQIVREFQALQLPNCQLLAVGDDIVC